LSGSTALLRDARLVVSRRDLASLKNEKTIVLALLIQLFVAAFSSFLVVGLTSLYDPGSVAGQDVEIGVTGEAREELAEAVAEQSGATAIHFQSPADARESFEAGTVDALLIATSYPPPDDRGGAVIDVEAVAPEGSIRTTLVVVQIRETLQILERQERVERSQSLSNPPIALPPEANASPYFGFTYTVLLPLLLFLPPFISGSVAVDTVTEEIERGTLELLRVAPLSLLDIVDGKALAMVALAPAQAGLWILLLSLNSIPVANPLALLALVTAIAVLVVVIGVALALWIGRRKPAQLLYSIGTLVIFGAAVMLPEHPATTAAKLAVDSPTVVTYAHVVGYIAVAVVGYFAVRRFVATVRPESL
jgi:ABC-type Na+ efflux pump permease subunit